MSDRRLVAALLLLDLSILTLVLGHFVQLHDTSGFGSDEWNLPLGALAAALGVAAVVVAAPDRRARRALGIALLAGVAVLVLLQLTVDGFRFVWGSGEFELGALEVLLVCVGLVLVATGAPRPSAAVLPAVAEQPSVPWTVRALLYLARPRSRWSSWPGCSGRRTATRSAPVTATTASRRRCGRWCSPSVGSSPWWSWSPPASSPSGLGGAGPHPRLTRDEREREPDHRPGVRLHGR